MPATLKEIGLSDGEIKVYLALLKLGALQASKIKEDTKLHRTTIYDFLEKLLNKGLVNYVIKDGVKYFKATTPEKLLDFVKEKEDHVRDILPQLHTLALPDLDAVKVEVYKGVEGLKTILNDILRTGKPLAGMGIDETKFERFPVLLEQFFKKEEKAGIKERMLTSEKAALTYRKKTVEYRYIPQDYFNPTATLIYGDKVAVFIWEPFTVIVIDNAQLSDSYRKHFELLWATSKKAPKTSKQI
ncbi:MAG: helix-turn-helix domain-containing protein [bacterium]